MSQRFEIDFANVAIVGSAKLGFSIKPGKRYKPFGDDSDIDVTIVSPEMFVQIWKNAVQYRSSQAFWPARDKFFSYLSSFGWIRPDMFPQSQAFPLSQHWWDFFRNQTARETCGPYKIVGGLYYSWFFLESYQRICVEQCIQEIQDENISHK